MNILIIGSKGFIGSHCRDYFLRKGNAVYGCDVGVEYNDDRYFQVDATNANYEEVFSALTFDACINCSGAASVPDSLVHPMRDFSLNTHNVFLMLEAIRKHQPGCRFINLSSAAIYGNPVSLPVREEDVANPISPYGWHKYYAELACAEYARFYGVKTSSVRIFSAYGPGLRKQLFWDLYHKFKNEAAVTLFGTGQESRDFIYIEDIARSLEILLARGDFFGSVYNLGSGIETRIEEAVKIFCAQLRGNTSFKFSNEVRKGDPINWRSDVSRLSSLGFSPSYTLDEGLKKYVAWLEHGEK